MEQLRGEARDNAALRLEVFEELRDGRLDDLHLDIEGQDQALAFVNDGVYACDLQRPAGKDLSRASCAPRVECAVWKAVKARVEDREKARHESAKAAAEDAEPEEMADEHGAADEAATQAGAPVMFIGNVAADITRADLRKVWRWCHQDQACPVMGGREAWR
jgi:hypothetical protein